MAGSIDDIVVQNMKEYQNDLIMFKKAMEILKWRNYVSVIDHGARSFILK